MIPDLNPYKIPPIWRALLVSGMLNIILLTLLFYFYVREMPPRPYFELKPADAEQRQQPLALEQSNSQVLRQFRQLSLEQLVAKLTNTQVVENGYTQRDMALAALIAFYHFDLGRALQDLPPPTQTRKIPYGRNREGRIVDAVVYPSLPDAQYQAIIRFAQTERWPVTTRGLFLQIRKHAAASDPTLLDAFFLSPEFLAIEMLFNRSETTVERDELISILTQGTWSMLESFAEQQRSGQDLSPARRQRFLLDYIQRDSRTAAYLLLKTDLDFASRKLDDKDTLAVLNLLVEKTPTAEQFALTLLTSPRSDLIWQLAANRLYEYSGEPKPDSQDLYVAALKRFAPDVARAQTEQQKATTLKPTPAKTPVATTQKSTQRTTTPPKLIFKSAPKESVKVIAKASPTPRTRAYLVQEGDSLWKISRRFNVDVETLRAYNRLQSDFLKPGTILRIP